VDLGDEHSGWADPWPRSPAPSWRSSGTCCLIPQPPSMSSASAITPAASTKSARPEAKSANSRRSASPSPSPRPPDPQRTPRPPAGGQGPTRARPGLTGAGSLPRTAEVRALISGQDAAETPRTLAWRLLAAARSVAGRLTVGRSEYLRPALKGWRTMRWPHPDPFRAIRHG
jgi:hypothetical protein